MNFKQLTAFREVMLTGSVSEAARNLHRTQPAISATIASLESDLRCQLFKRRAGRLHPVPEAHYLFAEAGKILEALRGAEQTLKSTRDLEQGVLQIVSMPGPSVFLLPRLIARFVEGRPAVRVTLITRNSIQAQQLISAQQYDVGLADLGYAESDQSQLLDHDLYRFSCLCALKAGDPLTAKRRITPADLEGRAMAALFADHPSHRQTRTAFEAAGVAFQLRFETQYFLPLFTYVESGLACAVVDPLSAESYKLYRGNEQGVVFLPFEPQVQLLATIMTPAHRPQSILAQAFTEVLREEILRIHAAYQAA